jgi:cold shock CspA family protein
MSVSKSKSKTWLNGIVHWFDNKSGEGLVKAKDGTTYFVHYSAIESKKKWKSLKDKAEVKFQIIDDVTFSQVSKVKEI